MYAVIKSGGKQHRVEEGEVLRLEKLEAATGEEISFDNILMVGEGESVKIGTPYVAGSKVTAQVVSRVEPTRLRLSSLIVVSIRVSNRVIVSGLQKLRLLELQLKARS